MSRSTDRDYHEARAEEERRRAEEASDPAIARAHRELAALHQRKMMESVDDQFRLPRDAAMPSAKPERFN
jgi:hypothetical protein